MQFNLLNQFPIKIKKEINKNISRIIERNSFILGPDVKKLENKLAKFVGSKYCLGVSSGTDALLISLMAINIRKGDEVIVPSFSWISTASVVKMLGAKPVFVDIEKQTCNIDINKIKEKINKKTKAIIFVSLFGNVPDVDKINKIAKKSKLFVIEDAAQSFGARYKKKFSCNLSDIGCTSFFPSKPLGGYGDSGAVFTNNKKLFDRMKSIRVHGQVNRNKHDILGVNGRIDTIQSAILIAKLKYFNAELNLRKKKFNFYLNFFKKNNFKSIQVLKYGNFGTSAFAQFCLLTSKRKILIEILKKNKIPFAIYYPKPMNEQKIFQKNKLNSNLNSKIVSKQIISLPFSPYIKLKDQKKIIKVLVKNKIYL